MQNQKLVIVDCENCYTKNLVKILNRHKEYHYILIAGPYQKIDVSKHFVPMDLIRSKVACKNAADFLVITVAVLNIQEGFDEIYIVSNDKGFDSPILYLRGIGYKIQRIGSAYVENDFSFKGLPEATIKNCTSCYSRNDRRKALSESAEAIEKANRHSEIAKQTNRRRKDKTKEELERTFRVYALTTESRKKRHKKPTSNRGKTSLSVKTIDAIYCLNSITEKCKNGSNITVIRERIGNKAFVNPDKLIEKLVNEGILKVVYRKKTKSYQVYWSKQVVDNYITYKGGKIA